MELVTRALQHDRRARFLRRRANHEDPGDLLEKTGGVLPCGALTRQRNR
jgi:hypothetical protein